MFCFLGCHPPKKWTERPEELRTRRVERRWRHRRRWTEQPISSLPDSTWSTLKPMASPLSKPFTCATLPKVMASVNAALKCSAIWTWTSRKAPCTSPFICISFIHSSIYHVKRLNCNVVSCRNVKIKWFQQLMASLAMSWPLLVAGSAAEEKCKLRAFPRPTGCAIHLRTRRIRQTVRGPLAIRYADDVYSRLPHSIHVCTLQVCQVWKKKRWNENWATVSVWCAAFRSPGVAPRGNLLFLSISNKNGVELHLA